MGPNRRRPGQERRRCDVKTKRLGRETQPLLSYGAEGETRNICKTITLKYLQISKSATWLLGLSCTKSLCQIHSLWGTRIQAPQAGEMAPDFPLSEPLFELSRPEVQRFIDAHGRCLD